MFTKAYPMSLIQFAKNGDVNGARNLITSGYNIEEVDENGSTALMWAYCDAKREDHFEIARILLENGADPNKMNKWQCTALHYALGQDSRSVLSRESAVLLLSYGANDKAINSVGCKASCYAIDDKGMDLAQMIADSEIVREERIRDVLDGGDSVTTKLLRNVKNGDFVKVMKLCKNSKVNLNCVDEDGNTPLILAYLYATKESYFQIAHYLLQHQAMTNVSNSFGYTPLICACGITKISSILITDSSKMIFRKDAASLLITYGAYTSFGETIDGFNLTDCVENLGWDLNEMITEASLFEPLYTSSSFENRHMMRHDDDDDYNAEEDFIDYDE